MAPYVLGFIRSALIWLGVGLLLGVSMAFVPVAVLWRPAHVHANLLGFVSMMIFGVAYHVIPRFAGAPLHRPASALAHLWVANAGLALLVSGWLLRPALAGAATPLLRVGAVLSAVGGALFIHNLWRTLDAAPRPGPVALTGRGPSPSKETP